MMHERLMPLPIYTVRCTKKELVAPGVYELRFTKPEGFTYKPGQFILFDVPLLEDELNIQARAYSLASINEETDLLFIVKMKEGGRFSSWLEKKIEVGSEMKMKGPFGLFLVKPSTHKLLFAATGAGIAPFRAQILAALKQNDQREMHLFFGVRSIDDLFWTDQFQIWEKSHKNFHFHICLSGDNPSWDGKKGRIQLFIPLEIKDHNATDLYICGAPEMTKEIKTLALEHWKLPKPSVHAEGYI